jgi:hypothetical protein
MIQISGGQRFGKLVVADNNLRIPISPNRPEKLIRAARCVCDCGNELVTPIYPLLNGKTKSCGCSNPVAVKTHGGSGTTIYTLWLAMRTRCRPDYRQRQNYYDKGIHVCADWKNFPAFREWALAHGYKPGLCIDRKNCDEGYEPGNCRFVTPTVSAQNKHPMLSLTAFGEELRLFEWLTDPRCKADETTVRRRLARGASPEEALSKPHTPTPRPLVVAFGEAMSIRAWSKDNRCVVEHWLLYKRLKSGWDPESAISTPFRRERRPRTHG